MKLIGLSYYFEGLFVNNVIMINYWFKNNPKSILSYSIRYPYPNFPHGMYYNHTRKEFVNNDKFSMELVAGIFENQYDLMAKQCSYFEQSFGHEYFRFYPIDCSKRAFKYVICEKKLGMKKLN